MIVAMPFVTSEHDDTDPTIELAVVPPRRFRLLRPFAYRAADGSFWDVPADGTSTDLASVPAPLWSLLASYGHQTRPALLHDHVSDLAKATPDRREGFAPRDRADRLLRGGLAEGGGRSAPRRGGVWAGGWPGEEQPPRPPPT